MIPGATSASRHAVYPDVRNQTRSGLFSFPQALSPLRDAAGEARCPERPGAPARARPGDLRAWTKKSSAKSRARAAPTFPTTSAVLLRTGRWRPKPAAREADRWLPRTGALRRTVPWQPQPAARAAKPRKAAASIAPTQTA